MFLVYLSTALLKPFLRQTINLTTNVNATTLTILTANGYGLQAGILHFKTSSSAKLIGKLSYSFDLIQILGLLLMKHVLI
jgi:hypothetical protein